MKFCCFVFSCLFCHCLRLFVAFMTHLTRIQSWCGTSVGGFGRLFGSRSLPNSPLMWPTLWTLPRLHRKVLGCFYGEFIPFWYDNCGKFIILNSFFDSLTQYKLISLSFPSKGNRPVQPNYISHHSVAHKNNKVWNN